MAILDKLLEKKDVLAYIDFRILSLKCDLGIALESTLHDNKTKGLIKERFYGRITELEELRKIVHQGTVALKFKSKSYSRKSKYLGLEHKKE